MEPISSWIWSNRESSIYLLYPDDPKTDFNQEFFSGSPNILSRLLPDATRFDDLIQVIDVPSVADGKYAQVVADPRTQKALCFLSANPEAH